VEDVSFGTLWEAIAADQPDAVAISEPGRDHPFAEFDDRAARLAAALEAAGVGPGDKVACYLYNGAPYLETVFAAFKLGAVPVNANYRYTQEELTALLADADAAALVFSGALAANVAHAARELPSLRLLVRVGPLPAGPPDAPVFPEAADLASLYAVTAPRPRRARPGSDELFMYTGGTTGKPKGVIWRHRDLFGSMSVLTRPGRFDPRHVWETVAAQRVRTLLVAGNAVCQPLVDELIAADAAGRPHDLSPLDSVTSSGTVLSDRVKRALHERAAVTITDALASSEGGPFATAVTSSVADLPSRFYPTPGTRVLAADGQPVVPGSGQIGTLAFGGPIPSGYYKDAVKTSATFRVIGEVRYTMPGDLATIEADGSIRFLGRGAGVINTGGEKVHPQEVEDVLLTCPGVTDVSVVGVPDETWGERVVAVVATDNPALTGQDLRAAVRRRLAGYKVPRAVILLPALPRTPTGKLELSRIRGIAAGEGPPQ
jgi:3-oxocholest-4-en-26-oate---CoA ligase